MVERILKIFQRQWGSLHEAAYLLGFFALLSQILGLFRDRFLAHSFGASAPLDVYYAAFRIPDFLFVSLASLAGAYVLIPFFIEKRKAGKEEARRFLSQVFTALFFLMAVVSAILFAVMPYLAPYAAPGFSSADLEEFVFLSRLLLISPFLLGFSNLLGSVTQALEKFFLFAMSPILYNLGIILGIAFFAPHWGVQGVAFGVLIGAFFHLAVQLPAVLSEGLFPRFSRVNFRQVGAVFAVSLPRTLALSANHFAILVLVAIASLVSQGSVSIFQFAFNLQSAPLSIIGVSYSVAAFPMLVRLFGSGDTKKFLEHMGSALRHIIFWSIPVVFLMIVLRAQIVRVILGSGAFNWEHTRLVAAALAVF
ncbi:oligosaccharide flippase family protein, partial [bacterium]|nr:oligosaccharide flippase family protein [bacterium]